MPRARSRNETEPTQMPLDVLQENQRLEAALGRARQTQNELRTLLARMTATPWHPALLQRVIDAPEGRRALVWIGPGARLVALHPELDRATLGAGDFVYLDQQQHTVMALANGAFASALETACFERFTPDGRLVARVRGEELVLEGTPRLAVDALRSGDLVLFDRPSRMALERLAQAQGEQYLLGEPGPQPPPQVGGHAGCLEALIGVLTAGLVEPELARSYQLGGRRAVLLYGPPGCGKTLMARTAAAEIERLSGKRCRFAVVRPGEFESSYVGESEANIRSCFRALSELADDELAVLFLDEIESIGRIRGAAGARHADRFLAALLAEIDGFSARGPVAILAATNRRDLLDPALLERLSDVQIEVPRPDLHAAREIFGVHLAESLLYCGSDGRAAEPGGREAAEARSEVLDAAVSQLYAPNAPNEVCRLQLRDGTSRTVHAREIVSGRLIEQIALAVRERAFRRHVRGERVGVSAADASSAIAEAIAQLSTTLTVHNARAYLHDLPEDVDVVRAEPIRPRPQRTQRFLHAS